MANRAAKDDIVVLDVGGTHFRVGIFSPRSGSVRKVRQFPTPSFVTHPEMSIGELQGTLVEDILGSARRALEMERNSLSNTVGISLCGPVDANGTVLRLPTVWGKDGGRFPMKTELEAKAPDLRWVIRNDMTAAAARYGSQKKYSKFRRICVVTVSSGIGMKVYDVRLKEALIDESTGFGGEVGHVRTDSQRGSLLCDCGEFGHVGAVASGRGAERLAQQRARENREGFLSSAIYETVHGDPAQVRATDVARGIKMGDPFCLDVLDRATRPLAQVIRCIEMSIAVGKFIIIGGFALRIGESYLESLRQSLVEVAGVDYYGRQESEIRGMVTLGERDEKDGLVGIGILADRV